MRTLSFMHVKTLESYRNSSQSWAITCNSFVNKYIEDISTWPPFLIKFTLWLLLWELSLWWIYFILIEVEQRFFCFKPHLWPCRNPLFDSTERYVWISPWFGILAIACYWARNNTRKADEVIVFTCFPPYDISTSLFPCETLPNLNGFGFVYSSEDIIEIAIPWAQIQTMLL